MDEGTRAILNKSWEIFHLPNVQKNLRKAAHEKLNFQIHDFLHPVQEKPYSTGPPSDIYSDKAGDFKGASNGLKELFEFLIGQ